MKRAPLLALILGWFVTTNSGAILAGPFTNNADCVREARAMIRAGYSNVSSICRYYN